MFVFTYINWIHLIDNYCIASIYCSRRSQLRDKIVSRSCKLDFSRNLGNAHHAPSVLRFTLCDNFCFCWRIWRFFMMATMQCCLCGTIFRATTGGTQGNLGGEIMQRRGKSRFEKFRCNDITIVRWLCSKDDIQIENKCWFTLMEYIGKWIIMWKLNLCHVQIRY